MKEDKYITIYKKGDVHIVDMLQEDVLVQKTEIHMDRRFIDDICKEFQRITLMANRISYEGSSTNEARDIIKNLKIIGEVLYKHLFPTDIQKALKASSASDLHLRLDEKILHIPWELCFDGEEFLSLKFRIGRQVLTEKKIVFPARRIQKEQISMLIIIDPSETLKHAQKEAEVLFSILEKETDIKIELIGGRHANKLNLLKEMKGKDIVHFIGHSFFDEKNAEKSGWILKDGILTSEETSKIDCPPSIVFSNSCQSLAVSSPEGYLFDEKSFGIGGGFMIAGVRNFIGPMWVIHDESSARFTADFYREFISGKSLGQSLQEAKRNVIKRDGPSNLLWASYMLYGDPSYKLTDFINNVSDITEKVTTGKEIKEIPDTIDMSESSNNAVSLSSSKYLSSHLFRNIVLIVLFLFLAIAGIFFSFSPLGDRIYNVFLNNYHPVSGPWGWRGGNYTLLTDYWDGEAITFINNKPLKDFVLELTAYQGQPAWPDAGFGVLIGNDVSDGLIFYLGSNMARWFIQKDGKRNVITSKRSLYFPDKARIKITAINGKYSAYINGKMVSRVVSPLGSKDVNVGLLIDSRWRVAPGFDNIKIRRLEAK